MPSVDPRKPSCMTIGVTPGPTARHDVSFADLYRATIAGTPLGPEPARPPAARTART